MQFTGEQLSDPELLRIWQAYDTSGDGKMNRDELAFLMEDLCEVCTATLNCIFGRGKLIYAIKCRRAQHTCTNAGEGAVTSCTHRSERGVSPAI